eukprot:s2238_g18.t1
MSGKDARVAACNREYTASVSPLTAPLTPCQKITMKRKRRKRRRSWSQWKRSKWRSQDSFTGPDCRFAQMTTESREPRPCFATMMRMTSFSLLRDLRSLHMLEKSLSLGARICRPSPNRQSPRNVAYQRRIHRL